MIQKVGEHEIRHTGKGLNVEGNVGNDVLIELIARAAERFQGSLAAYGPAEFQRRVARVAGANHLAGSFVGAWRDKNGKIHYLRHAGPEHVLCYAPTRSGKGVGLSCRLCFPGSKACS